MAPQIIPQHIAIIMDGNGRWAQEKGLSRVAGHREGRNSLREVLKACAEIGVKYLTVYAFSTENWRRPKEEVDFLMELFSQTIEAELDDLMQNNVKLCFLGRITEFSKELQDRMNEAMEKTKNNKGINLNVMVNYGGRAELVDAAKAMIEDKRKTIDEEIFGQYLYTKGIPDPDLLIRTASEMRVSNFLLWQIAYSELYITPILWPDFRKEQLKEAVAVYQTRVRKYGKTKEQISD